jgi:predicted deacylase
MNKTLTIGDIATEAGSKSLGLVAVAERSDGSKTSIPVMVVNGRGDGPVLCVAAGIHGDEYVGMAAIKEIARTLDPNDVHGAFLGVPVVNVEAFVASSRTNPFDGLNLNRVFPGKRDGFISEMIAHTFMEEIVSKADYYIDLHTGCDHSLNAPMMAVSEANSDEKTIEFAKSFGFELIWMMPAVFFRGGLSSADAASKKGIVGIGAEIGGGARCPREDVEAVKNGLMNVMKKVGIISGKPKLLDKYVYFTGDVMHAKKTGFFVPLIGLRDKVSENQLLGKTYDLFGNVIEEVRAPWDGFVTVVRVKPTVNAGDWTILVGKEYSR